MSAVDRTATHEPVLRGSAAVKVPQIVAAFWVAKALTTALGESTSDYLVHRMAPVLAVLIGFALFCVALALQLRSPRYVAWRYWLAVSMVGIFGTMAADVVHVGFGIPYAVSAPVFACGLAAVFVLWYRVEGTLSIHSITTRRRELFYWAAVVATFALGTAVGDLTAMTLGLGYLASAVMFAVLILVPAIGHFRFGLNAVLAFWAAYVLTRPLGASLADWGGKSRHDRGLGIGSGWVSLVLAGAVIACVAYFQVSRVDRPAGHSPSERHGRARSSAT